MIFNLALDHNKMFPTPLSKVVFVGYIVLFANQGLLIKASQIKGENYGYNPIILVLLTEIIKALLATSICIYNGQSLKSLVQVLWHQRTLGLLYMIPAILYCLYNTLAFVALSALSPSSYFALMQLRIIVTALLYQVVFKRKLSYRQWFSLFIITIGCLLDRVDSKMFALLGHASNTFVLEHLLQVGPELVVVFVQILCSVSAGLGIEYLLKQHSSQSLMVHNILLYLDSILFNVYLLWSRDEIFALFDEISSIFNLKRYASPLICLMVLNNALVGLTTSLFLATMNSILKAIASALELVFIGILSFWLLKIDLQWNNVLAILFIATGVIHYAKNPVPSSTKSKSKTHQYV